MTEISDSGLHTLVEGNVDGMLLLDADGAILYANPAASEMLGMDADLLRGATFGLPLDADDGGEIDINASGGARVVSLRTARVEWEGSLATLATLRDVSARHDAERALREANETLRTVIAAAPAAIIRLDAEGLVLSWNPAAERMFGYAEADMIGAPSPIMLGDGIEPGEDETVIRKDGTTITVSTSESRVLDEHGAVETVVLVATDLTDRLDREAQVRMLASHDQLTGLLNRRAFEEAVARVVRRAQRNDEATPIGALLMLDLDHFKTVNDSAGHLAGDQMLIGVARVIEHGVRPGEVVARFGGDEFAVLLTGTDLAGATAAADRLRDHVRRFELNLGGRPHRSTATVGGVVIDGQLDASDLHAVADLALHTAKDAHRDSTLIQEHAVSRALELAETARRARALREAIDAGLFVVEHQPLVDLLTGEVVAFEALIRMPSPTGQRAPDEFLPLAEEIGLMWEIDAWMTRSALRRLRDPSHARIWVNLRASSIGHPALAGIVAEAPPSSVSRLGFEISERTLADDFARARDWFAQLHTAGCRFALDDFGTGAAAFGSLRVIPIDLVKIDRQYVGGVAGDASGRRVLQALVQFAHDLGAPVLAEGLEHEADRVVARELGAGFGQGFLWPGRTAGNG